jgi:hypothetical protein
VSEQQVKVFTRWRRRKGASITGVALAYVMHKAPYISPMSFSNSDIRHLRLIDLDVVRPAYDQKVALQRQPQLKRIANSQVYEATNELRINT